MKKLTPKKLAVAIGGAAVMLSASTGVASADPIVDTTCSYPQVIAALNATDPDLAQRLNRSPFLQGEIQRFLASPRAERQRTADQYSASRTVGPYFGRIAAVANTCNNF